MRFFFLQNNEVGICLLEFGLEFADFFVGHVPPGEPEFGEVWQGVDNPPGRRDRQQQGGRPGQRQFLHFLHLVGGQHGAEEVGGEETGAVEGEFDLNGEGAVVEEEVNEFWIGKRRLVFGVLFVGRVVLQSDEVDLEVGEGGEVSAAALEVARSVYFDPDEFEAGETGAVATDGLEIEKQHGLELEGERGQGLTDVLNQMPESCGGVVNKFYVKFL